MAFIIILLSLSHFTKLLIIFLLILCYITKTVRKHKSQPLIAATVSKSWFVAHISFFCFFFLFCKLRTSSHTEEVTSLCQMTPERLRAVNIGTWSLSLTQAKQHFPNSRVLILPWRTNFGVSRKVIEACPPQERNYLVARRTHFEIPHFQSKGSALTNPGLTWTAVESCPNLAIQNSLKGDKEGWSSTPSMQPFSFPFQKDTSTDLSFESLLNSPCSTCRSQTIEL